MNRSLRAPGVPDVTQIDHDWLRAHLGWQLAGDEGVSVDSLSHSDGQMGGVYRVVCGGHSFIFKGPPENPAAWGGLVAETDLVEREVRSYELLGRNPSLSEVAPDCYWSVLDADGRGALALEDLGAPPTLSETMTDGLSHAQALAAVRSLAVVHAGHTFADAEPASPPYPWLFTARSAGLMDWLRLGIVDLPRLAEKCWPEGLVDERLSRVLDADMDAVLDQCHFGAEFISLCHGDTWAGNILFRDKDESAGPPIAYLTDWQFAMWGNPLSDVALFMQSSLSQASREAWEKELLQQYYALLMAHGMHRYSLEACLADFQRAEAFGALVGLATLEDYTLGMNREQLIQFAPRVIAAMDCVAGFKQF